MFSGCWIDFDAQPHQARSRTADRQLVRGRQAARYFYFDDILARRLRPDLLTSEQALEQAKALARAERGTGRT